MLTITFAFVVATALFFLFERTRWMGVVGVFVLLCINPLLFTGLLLIAGVASTSSSLGENSMYPQSNYLDAIETVLAWDLPDEVFPDAVQSQVRLMAGISPEDGMRG